jgi:RNA polymerase sigma-70 factor (ECF subfamily)
MTASRSDPFKTTPPPECSPQACDISWEEESAVFAVAPSEPPSPTAAAGQEVYGPHARPSNPAELGAIFNQYRRYVAKIGRRILGPAGDVDDLIQDVFLTTIRDIEKIKEPAKLRGWLATVTTRMAKRRRFRSAVQHSQTPDDPDEIVRMPSGAPSPESTAYLSDNIQRVLNLPDELRTPWMLKHIEGHTLQDVAEQCDCSMSTAQRRIQTASGRLNRKQ